MMSYQLKYGFIKIRAGEFLMGSPESEIDRSPDEYQHRVQIKKDFELSTTPVTQAQWEKVMGSNPSYFTNNPNNPVECVSWDEAQKFIQKLNEKKDGYLYRLPTEAEWEYACRGGTETRFNFGNDENALSEYTWHNSQTTHPVAKKKPNRLGLYDMHGNVWEWVSDYWANDYEKYPNGGPSSGSFRVFRGGSWSNYARYLRSAYRNSYSASLRRSFIGFRLARTIL